MNTKTHIIATLGPSSHTKETISSMIDEGMDMVRLNFSWGTYEEMASYISIVREAAAEKGKTIPIIQDLSGPRMSLEHGHKIDDSSEKVITEKDIKDLEFGLEHSVEYIALSYVSSAQDVHDLRARMVEKGNVTPIIAKIERQEALDNLEGICDAADGIMIARGDLGKALPYEELPTLEKRIVSLCKEKQKFVIVATEMMLSMTEAELPTRAGVTDVSYAVLLGADAVMLSEESSTGKHPVETVRAMNKIITFTEEEKDYPHHLTK